MTPVEEKDLEPKQYGNISNQILDILNDKQGYYKEELLKRIHCSHYHMYRVLSKLKRKGLIVSKTMPKESKKRGLHKNSKVYYKTPDSLDLR